MTNEKQNNLRLVSAYEKFTKSPSARGLIELLEERAERSYFSHEELDRLLACCDEEFLFGYQDIVEFDDLLWSQLSRFDISIWWNGVLPKETEQGRPTPPAHAASSSGGMALNAEILSTTAQAISFSEGRGREIDELKLDTGNPLAFFAEVNGFFRDVKEFSPYLEKSKELAEFLVSLCANEKKKEPKKHLRDDEWSMVFHSIARCYASGLRSISKDHSDENAAVRFTANYLSCAGHIAFIAVTNLLLGQSTRFSLISEITKSSPFASIDEDGTGNKNIPKEMLDNLLALIDLALNKGDLGSAIRFLKIFLLANQPQYFTHPKAWRLFCEAWISEHFEIDGVRDRDERARLYEWAYLLPSSLRGLVEPDGAEWLLKDRYQLQLEGHPEEAKAFDLVLHFLRWNGERNKDNWREFCCYLLADVQNYNSVDDLDQALRLVATWLVKEANKESTMTGLPTFLPFISRIEQASGVSAEGTRFIHKRKEYYSSISTLAINLADEEASLDIHGSQFRNYLQVAQLIAREGHPEHAVVFLAYSLFACAFMPDLAGGGIVSVRELNEATTKDLEERWVAKYLPPILILILESGRQLPADYRMWISSFLSKYNLASVVPLRIVETIPEEDAVEMPAWFGGLDASSECKHAVQSVKTALRESENKDPRAWAEVALRHHVRNCCGELLREIEAVSKRLFRNVYETFCDQDGQLQKAYSTYAKVYLKDYGKGRVEFGWMKQFLGGITSSRWTGRDSDRAFDALLSVSRARVPGLEDVLRQLRRKEALTIDFSQAHALDNTLSHNAETGSASQGVVIKSQMSRTNAQWILDYTTIEFGVLYGILSRLKD